MNVAFVLFDGMTSLDFFGFFEPVTLLKSMDLLPNLEWEVCARSAEVRDDKGLTMRAGRVVETLEGYDLVFLPGGRMARTLKDDASFIAWLRSAQHCPYKVSVCTGSLLLGAAGFLDGRTATTNPRAYEVLAAYTHHVARVRIVDDQDVITAGAVATSIDLGLYVCEKLAGSVPAFRAPAPPEGAPPLTAAPGRHAMGRPSPQPVSPPFRVHAVPSSRFSAVLLALLRYV